jgi:hypothetical protein
MELLIISLKEFRLMRLTPPVYYHGRLRSNEIEFRALVVAVINCNDIFIKVGHVTTINHNCAVGIQNINIVLKQVGVLEVRVTAKNLHTLPPLLINNKISN